MTIMSSGGLQFGILQLVASFGNVWADQAYWQVCSSSYSIFLAPTGPAQQQNSSATLKYVQ